jgi:hypothetical protein
MPEVVRSYPIATTNQTMALASGGGIGTRWGPPLALHRQLEVE